MKKELLIILIGLLTFNLLLSSNVLAQSADSVIYESENMLLVKNLEKSRYKLTNKKTKDNYDDLKFVKRIFRYFQILDSNNQVFYIGEDWEKKEEVIDFIGVCGTVPHYTLTVQLNETYFEIIEDETFYDYTNEIPAEIKRKIDQDEADSVLFINGNSSFKFTSNFDVGFGTTDPRMLILIKDGKYFTIDNPKLKYDSIDFTNYRHSLKTMKDHLYGLLGIVEPKYKRIEEFNYYLAEAETENGELVFIDTEGNEYKSVADNK